MAEMVQIRSVKQYFNEFIVESLKGKAKIDQMDLIRVKQQLLDSFRKELFEQLVFKYGADMLKKPRDEWASTDGVQNMLTNLFRKWRRLCILCSEQGLNFLNLEDLRDMLTADEAPDGSVGLVADVSDEKDVTGQIPEGTVISREEDFLPPITSGYIQADEYITEVGESSTEVAESASEAV